MDTSPLEGQEVRREDGPLERAIAGAIQHTPAVVVVSVEPDGKVTFGFHILNDAPPDVIVRLMCGTQNALDLLAQMLTSSAGEQVH